MTKAEAIKLIDNRMCFGRGKWSKHHMPEIDDYWKAGQIAIKALEEPERKKGKWIDNDKINFPQCSECGMWIDVMQQSGEMNFCPNCGADMRGESDE